MSDGSYGRIRTEPLQNIGAQDLLSVGYNYYGFLRKKRRFDGLKGSSRWKQRFVVLSEGCLYCFNHESSAKPMAAVALCFYESAHELFLKIPHCFQITHEEVGRSPLIFSCESEERRRQWIAHVKDTIEQSGQLSANSLNLSDQSVDEGIVADKTLERPFPKRNVQLPALPAVPPDQPPGAAAPKAKRYKETARSEYDLESEEEEDDESTEIYDDIVEEDQTKPVTSPPARKAMTLPGMVSVFPGALPSRPFSISSRAPMPPPPSNVPLPTQKVPIPLYKAPLPTPKVPLPIPKVPLPTSPRTQDSSSDEGDGGPADYINIFQSDDYHFDSNDRDQARSNLASQPDGTFLIRKSRSSASRVLSVMVNGDVKEFQITEDEGRRQVSIDKTSFYPSLDAMLNYYHQHDLPKSDYSVKLKRGFRATSK